MKNVLFVDDDKSVLQGLKRMLRSLRNEWNMHFVRSGEEALDVLSQNKFDVIVSDMRMPGMNGAELLSRIRNKYPHMVRIILSGFSDQDMLLKAVRPAHQFLSKPCDAAKLKKTVQRASTVQKILSGKELKKVVTQIDSLPSLPNLYTEIIEKLQQDDVSVKEISKIIQQDMGMTAQILKLVNSSFFGFYKDISSPIQAVTLLGLDTIKTLVLSIEIFSALKGEQKMDFSYEHLWNHSALTATLAKIIASKVSSAHTFIEDAYMAGFLHDIGILILASKLPDKYAQVLNKVTVDKTNLAEAEQAVLGTGHTEIGAYLLGLWGFADNIIEAVIHHHHARAHGDEPESLSMVLYLAELFAHRLDPTIKEVVSSEPDPEYIKKINLSVKIEECYAECKKIVQEGASNE